MVPAWSAPLDTCAASARHATLAALLAWAVHAAPALAQDGSFPSPLALDYFPSCACEQANLPLPGTWQVDVQNFTMRDAQDPLNSHDGDDNGFFDADIGLRREFCGETLDFPGSAQPPLNLLVRFEPDGQGGWRLKPGSKPMGGTGTASLTPIGSQSPPAAYRGHLTSTSMNGIANFDFTLTMTDGETPGLGPSATVDLLRRFTGAGLPEWSDLPCWCREAERSYKSAWQIYQAFADPSILASAEGSGSFTGRYPAFRGQPDWDDLAAGNYGVDRRDTAEGQGYQARATTAANAQMAAEDYDPFGHAFDGGGVMRRVAGTNPDTCAKDVPDLPSRLRTAASHIHEDVHVADCLRARDAYEEMTANNAQPDRIILDSTHFRQTWFNTPANLSDSEVRAYAATMRFFLDFHDAHCRPIIDAFDLD